MEELHGKFQYNNLLCGLALIGDTTENLSVRFKTEATLRLVDEIIQQCLQKKFS